MSSKRFSLRRVFCSVLILLLFVSSPLSVLAATYTVSSGAEMADSWNAANTNKDLANYFEMTNDIDMSGYELATESNRLYFIQSAPGTGDHEISDLYINTADGITTGSTVLITADITSSENAALTVVGGADVIVMGDITTTSAATGDGNHMAVDAAIGSSVVINGDVSAAEAGINADLADVTVNGNVTLTSEGKGYLNHVISTDRSGTVTVNGSVSSEELGVFAMGDSDITVTGNVTLKAAGNGEPSAMAILASDKSTVTVGGNVTSDVGGILTNNADITVGGSVESQGEVSLNNGSTLKVSGNLTTAPNAAGPTGMNGVWLNNSDLTVEGACDTPQLLAENNSHVDVAMDMRADLVEIAPNMSSNDKTVLQSSNIVGRSGSVSFNAGGSSVSTVKGKVEGAVYAFNNALVNIWSTAEFCTAADQAIINVNVSNGNKSESITNLNPNDLLTLCKSYQPGSRLDVQYEQLHSLYSKVSEDLSEKMGYGDAALTAVFHGLEGGLAYFTDTMKYHGYAIDDANHPQSVQNYRDTIVPNFYHVELYMDNLHELFDNLDVSNSSNVIDRDSVKKIFDLVKFVHGSTKTGTEQFTEFVTPEMGNFLKIACKDGLNLDEAKEFLFKFDIIKGDKASRNLLAKCMEDMFDYFDDFDKKIVDLDDLGEKAGPYMEMLGQGVNMLEVAFRGAEFIDFWVSDYAGPISIIDTILAEQPLPCEIYLALVGLRAEYKSDFLHLHSELEDLTKDGIAEILSGRAPVFKTFDPFAKTGGFLLGLNNKTQERLDGAAMQEIAPILMNNYLNSVAAVRDGDTSEDALLAVETNYELLVSSLEELCNSMISVASREQKAEYKSILAELQSLRIGQDLTLPAA